jgi:primosomal protein N' (replication factor Y)
VTDCLFPTGDNHPPARAYALVAVQRSIDRIDDEGMLVYAVEGAMPVPGQCVDVPLGKSRRFARGVVVQVGGDELLRGLSPTRVRGIGGVHPAVLPEEVLELGRWIARYYVCPLGMVMASILPSEVASGKGERTTEYVDLAPAWKDLSTELPDGMSRGARKAWKTIVSHGCLAFPMPLRTLAGALGYRTTRPFRPLIEAGVLVVHHVPVAPKDHALRESVEAERAPGEIVLTSDQRRVIDGVSLGEFGVHLLRGVTGSGKTEVYLRLIDRVLATGKGAIVLVPEISLTPQAVERFASRFGADVVAVLHSALTPARRRREWERVAAGRAKVVVGARSAVFAPLASTGLIVVDEEHDSSYKQDRLPRYHGRDTAIMRARLAGCPVLLGSATPSLESWANAESGRYRLWELAERVGGAALPRVAVVSIADERRARMLRDPEDTRAHLVGPTLQRALENCLTSGGQAILLLNRRGLAQYVWCRAPRCDYVLCCDDCDATLVVHRAPAVPAGAIVRCHHCDAAQRVPALCPRCGSKLALFGFGTQRAEEELAEKLAALGIVPGESLLRLDSDAVRSVRDVHDVLARFARGEARVLVGTQMLAKGLDYPNVRLVGVLDADTAINIPDFRAAERTFQLVSQVSGRAGRGRHPGEVIIQTMRPDEPAIALAAAHDYPAFARRELEARRRHSLPPAVRMARIVCRDKVFEHARERAAEIARRLAAHPDLRVRGPMVPALARIAGFHRVAIDVMAARAGVLQEALQTARAEGLLKSDARTAVDVDPVALL